MQNAVGGVARRRAADHDALYGLLGLVFDSWEDGGVWWCTSQRVALFGLW